jgi:multiple sugar transport system ATP-binding protein
VIAGLRPEDFEDASLVGQRDGGITFKAKIDVLESMGSEFYAYFEVEAENISSSELDELAQDAGAADLPHTDGNQIVARLEAASRVRQGDETELWYNGEHLHLFDPDSGASLLGSLDGNGANFQRTAPAASAQTPTPDTAEQAPPQSPGS